MIYTIVAMTEHCRTNPLRLEIEKQGDKFCVILSDKRGSLTKRQFDGLMDAYKVFEKIAGWMVFGLYSEKDRRQYLASGTMN